ncbi:putative invertase/pectin methylesterase inhibitor domain superfamily [Helianthus anomalus]
MQLSYKHQKSKCRTKSREEDILTWSTRPKLYRCVNKDRTITDTTKNKRHTQKCTNTMTHDDTCSKGFKGDSKMNSVVRGKIMNVAQLTSNALDLISSYASLCE